MAIEVPVPYKSIYFQAGGDVFVLFSGSKDESGASWCPDCVTADPVVKVNKCEEKPPVPCSSH